MARRLGDGVAEQTLEDDHVAPLAVEAPMAPVQPDALEAAGLEQLQARRVAGEDLGEQLVAADPLALGAELAQERLSDALAAGLPGYVDRGLADTLVVAVVLVGA